MVVEYGCLKVRVLTTFGVYGFGRVRPMKQPVVLTTGCYCDSNSCEGLSQ